MKSIANILSLAASIPTIAANLTGAECGSINVFYTGFPPYHPLVEAQGFDPAKVDTGLRKDALNMVKAGYNVQVVWAGTEVPISTLEGRIEKAGVDFDIGGIGFGIRGAKIKSVVERLEDIIDLYHRKLPSAAIVFNYSPESCVWSVSHRVPMREDCAAVGKPGKLLGYEEICNDALCINPNGPLVINSDNHDEL